MFDEKGAIRVENVELIHSQDYDSMARRRHTREEFFHFTGDIYETIRVAGSLDPSVEEGWDSKVRRLFGSWKESGEEDKQLQELRRCRRIPSTSLDLAGEFKNLVQEWRSAVAHKSSVTEMAIHPAYQKIIGMGPAAVPLLLRELEQKPDHWFWALGAITGEDPVKPEERGRIKLMAQAWLKWGRERGYEW